MIVRKAAIACTIVVLALSTTARAREICVKPSPKTAPVKLRSVCKAKEVSLGDESLLVTPPVTAVTRVENLCVFDQAHEMGNPNGNGNTWDCSVACPAGLNVIGGSCAMGLSPGAGASTDLVNQNCEPSTNGSWDMQVRFSQVDAQRGLSMRVKAICTDTGGN